MYLLDDPDWRTMLQNAAGCTKAFASLFLQDRFHRPFASITDAIFAAIDGPDQKVLIKAPRGWGKTSINSIAYPARHICFRLAKFIVPISATATKAELEAENLKFELMTNPLITEVFPNLKTDIWTKDKFLVGDTFVMPRGAGQQVRGINFRGNRPDLIIVDDLEDPEHVRSDEQRAKLAEWFAADVENSVDRGSDNWRIIVIGTVLHEDSLLMRLSAQKGWKTITIELCDDDLNSNWPAFMTTERVKELYEEFRDQGKADVFAREYQNRPISMLDATFRHEYFRWYEPEDLYEQDIEYITIIDPAKSVQKHTADTAVVTWGIDRQNHRLYFHDCDARKMYPEEIYEVGVRQCQMHGSAILGVEVTSLHEFIVQPLKNAMRQHNLYTQLMEIQARGNKADRIAELAPYYRQGLIHHNKRISGKMERQLLSFPRSALWDVMDAAAYVIPVLERRMAYWNPVEVDTVESIEAEYAELKPEPELGTWRLRDV